MTDVKMSLEASNLTVADIKSLNSAGTLPDDAVLFRDPERGCVFYWYETF